jgi:hypothetical protein
VADVAAGWLDTFETFQPCVTGETDKVHDEAFHLGEGMYVPDG